MTGNEIKMPVKVTPFDHQRRAFQFVLWLFGMTDGRVRSTGAALLMQMGTGKSLVGIAICGYLYLMKKIRRVLVVCPLSICGVWQEEFAKFANFPVQLVILNGAAAKKRQQIESLQDDGTLQVIVVNYESSWRLLPELQKYDADVIIIDTGAGISDAVLEFLVASGEILLVTTPEPTSITDSYSLLKALNRHPRFSMEESKIKVIANKVVRPEDGNALFSKLNVVVQRYLKIPIEYLGYVPQDDKLSQAVMQQTPVSLASPQSRSSKAYETIAANLMNLELNKDVKKRGMAAFFSHIVIGKKLEKGE